MKRLLSLLILAGFGCGQAPPSLSTIVLVKGLLKDEVASMTVYAFGNVRTDDIFLTCTTLVDGTIEPSDARVEKLAQVDIAFTEPTSRTVLLPEVEAGPERIVLVHTRDSAGMLNGVGCTPQVTVRAGETTPVEVTVFPI